MLEKINLLEASKLDLVVKFGHKDKDTGSTEVQVALLTKKINDLNQHFKKFAKDFHSKQGLLKMVGKRKKLLAYLKHSNKTRYLKLIHALDLRK